MKTNHLMHFTSTIVILLLISFFTAVKSHAVSRSIGVYPPLIKIQTAPDRHVQQEITISNYSDDPTILTLSLKFFTSSPKKNGEIVFLPNTTKAKDFFSEQVKVIDENIPVNQLLLAPQQQKTLRLDINTPKTQKEEDYYIAILFIANNTEHTKSNASLISTGVVTNVLLSVLPQPQIDSGYIKQFSAPTVIEKDTVPLSVALANQSDHYISAKGKISIYNMLLASKEIIELQPATILANDSRYMTDLSDTSLSQIVWKPGFLFGIYRADLEVFFGKNPKSFHKVIYFYSYPLVGFAIALGVIIFIGIIAFRIRKKRS